MASTPRKGRPVGFEDAVAIPQVAHEMHPAGPRPNWKALPLRQLSERTILCRRETKSSFEHPGKMRLVCEPGTSCQLAQRSEPSELLTCSIKPPHEQVVIRAGPAHQPKLAR